MKKAELVFIPLPAASHLSSMLEFAKLLLELDERISITVLIIKLPNKSTINELLAASSVNERITFIDIPYDDQFSEPNQSMFFLSLLESQKPRVKELVTNIFLSDSTSDSPRLAGFVIDMICTSMIDVANELGVPSYVFFTSGASFLSILLHLQFIHDERNVDASQLGSDVKLEVPGIVNPVPIGVLPRSLFNDETTAAFYQIARRIRENKGTVVNTLMELECCALNSLCDGKAPVVYPVGPILNLKSHSQDDTQKNSEIMEWLDDQPSSSVVFLCFGSMGTFGEAQVKEIARALEHSGHRFLWSLRQPPPKGAVGLSDEYPNLEDALPEGFLDRTVEIGKIIGWAPQAAILAHPAIGGFVSHCGWNSVLESVWFGVPIASWPIYAEQQINAFVLVKELGLAVDIKMDYWRDLKNEIIVSADIIERGIRGVMELDSETRKKAKEMSEKSRKALISGGSSHVSLVNFIGDIIENMP